MISLRLFFSGNFRDFVIINKSGWKLTSFFCAIVDLEREREETSECHMACKKVHLFITTSMYYLIITYHSLTLLHKYFDELSNVQIVTCPKTQFCAFNAYKKIALVLRVSKLPSTVALSIFTDAYDF